MLAFSPSLSLLQSSLPSVVLGVSQRAVVLSCFNAGLSGGVAHFFGLDAFADQVLVVFEIVVFSGEVSVGGTVVLLEAGVVGASGQ